MRYITFLHRMTQILLPIPKIIFGVSHFNVPLVSLTTGPLLTYKLRGRTPKRPHQLRGQVDCMFIKRQAGIQHYVQVFCKGNGCQLQAFSQKGVLGRPQNKKMDASGRPNSGGKGKLFSFIQSLSILIYLRRNSFNSHYYAFDNLINLMVYLAE